MPAKALNQIHPELRILVYTAHSQEKYLDSARELGVHGYLRKDHTLDSLVRALRALAAGDTWFREVALPRRPVLRKRLSL